ncbi:MAG: DHH family phosphoesterase [Candidatus Shapirobacteria bacterium]
MNKINALIKKAKNILITTHINPDPDALCSALATLSYLKKAYPKKKAKIIVTGRLFTEWETLKDNQKIKRVDDLVNHLDGVDLIIYLDGCTYSRFSSQAEELKSSKIKSICLDHHPGKPDYFDFCLINTRAIAACQIAADLFFADSKLLDKKTAETLMLGILSDSGNFRYLSYENSDSLITVKRLVDKAKINVQSLLLKIDKMNPDTFALLQILYRNTQNVKLKKLPSLTYSYLPLSVLGKYSYEDIANAYHKFLFIIVRQIKDHPWGFVVIPEEKNKFSISWRSNPGAPKVNLIAQQFGGGGHKYAAGSKLEFPPAKKSITTKQVCQKILEKLVL